MARTRYIKPGFFKNEDLSSFGPWHRLLFAGLWTIADRAGRLEDRPKRIKAELFPYDDEVTSAKVDSMLTDLANGEDPFVVRYEVNGVRCIAICKWTANQAPHRNEADSLLPSHRNTKKTEQSTEFGAMVDTKHNQGQYDAIPNGEWGMGNGELERGTENGDGDRADAPATPPAEVRRDFGQSILGQHRTHGWCNQRGLCVPASLYRELLERIGVDRLEQFRGECLIDTSYRGFVERDLAPAADES